MRNPRRAKWHPWLCFDQEDQGKPGGQLACGPFGSDGGQTCSESILRLAYSRPAVHKHHPIQGKLTVQGCLNIPKQTSRKPCLKLRARAWSSVLLPWLVVYMAQKKLRACLGLHPSCEALDLVLGKQQNCVGDCSDTETVEIPGLQTAKPKICVCRRCRLQSAVQPHRMISGAHNSHSIPLVHKKKRRARYAMPILPASSRTRLPVKLSAQASRSQPWARRLSHARSGRPPNSNVQRSNDR